MILRSSKVSTVARVSEQDGRVGQEANEENKVGLETSERTLLLVFPVFEVGVSFCPGWSQTPGVFLCTQDCGLYPGVRGSP